LVVTLIIAAACGGAQTQGGQQVNTVPPVSPAPTPTTEAAKTKDSECRICDFDFAAYKGDLKKEEIEGLLLALNDEYLAWATYDRINKDFRNPRPFVNIQRAEGQHAERLKFLFKTYGVAVPENNWIGNTPVFDTVAAACKAGVDAEIANRDLYARLLKSTQREDILLVYRELQRASEQNHLPAFQRCGEGGGGRGRGGRPF
jgi:hypothetical protein